MYSFRQGKIADSVMQVADTLLVDHTHNFTNIAIWHIVNDVIPVLDTGIQFFILSHQI
ncbi:MAG: hypothetical protein ACEY3M_16340 [Wolbachia sp.]